MSIRVTCPHCGVPLRAPDYAGDGRKVTCRACHQPFTLGYAPAPESFDNPPPVRYEASPEPLPESPSAFDAIQHDAPSTYAQHSSRPSLVRVRRSGLEVFRDWLLVFWLFVVPLFYLFIAFVKFATVAVDTSR